MDGNLFQKDFNGTCNDVNDHMARSELLCNDTEEIGPVDCIADDLQLERNSLLSGTDEFQN